MILLSKKDVVWSYIAQFFKIASGILILPIILRMLTTEEIALNYLLASIVAMVGLLDFGFSPQFGRNITYIFSGAQELKREGIQVVSKHQGINYKLLVTMIETARYVYLRIAFLVVLLLATLGTWYIYKVTNGLTSVDNAVLIWGVTILSCFFNFYYAYFDSLLIGRGLIKEAKKAAIFSKLVYIALAISFLYLGLGLLGVAISSLISAFVYRTVCYFYFYDNAFLKLIEGIQIDMLKRQELFKTLWHNARKLGLVFLSAYAINNFSIFLAGLYLDSDTIASYGVLMQLTGIITTVSSTLFMSLNPTFSALRTSGDNHKLVRVFAFSMNVYYVLFILGAFILVVFGPGILHLLGANVILPSATIMVVYSLIVFFEGNHSGYATLIVTNNQVPFLKSSVIAGVFVAFGDYIILAFTPYGLLGLILVQGIVQLGYANWKWPWVICKEFKFNFFSFLRMGIDESIHKVRNINA
ncbi:O-unit flippase-like protein [Pedobacter antarcticus]|uniref:O-unit flippase-like protein n=1 Tax=Pedobacter antarcticus TaxID=34086 RepID=UPI0029311712|nr:O-unit flippase-like protein [Pedobacter antarcticus]